MVLKSEFVLSNIKNQLLATLIANVIIFSHGSGLGWFSPALPILTDTDKTPLENGPISNDQIGWIGSISSVGSVCGTLLFGFISLKMGAKASMTMMAFPNLIFWILIRFGSSYYHILIARFIAGLTGGSFQTGTVLFISEISNNNIRGRLNSLLPLMRNFGVLMGFIVGSFVEYENVPYIFVFGPVVYLILLLTLPNTPQFYLHKDNIQNAEKALMYYKGCTGKNDHEKSLLKEEFDRLKLIEEERRNSPRIQFKDFCNRIAAKAIMKSVAISWFSQATGFYIITNYASLVFQTTGSALSVDTSAIILAGVQIVGGLVSTQAGDAFSRKTTMSISIIGSIAGLLTLSIYLYLQQNGYDVSNYTWLPLVTLSLIIFISSSGIIAITNTFVIEFFPSNIRTVGMTWFSLCNNFVAFVGDKSFPMLLDAIYLHGFFILLIINCCVGLVFIACMEETRGKSLESTKSEEQNSKC